MLATLWVDHGIYIPYVSMRLQNDLCLLPRPFSKLQLAPVNDKAETPSQPDDSSALRKRPPVTGTITLHSKRQLTCPFSTQLSDPCWVSCWEGHRRWTREVCFTINKPVLSCMQGKQVNSHLILWKKELPPNPCQLPTLGYPSSFYNNQTITVNQWTKQGKQSVLGQLLLKIVTQIHYW